MLPWGVRMEFHGDDEKAMVETLKGLMEESLKMKSGYSVKILEYRVRAYKNKGILFIRYQAKF